MWDPKQYELFRSERSLPFFDLLDECARRLDTSKKIPTRVVDLGCGTGELTKILHERLGGASTLGVDSSAEMLAKAPQGVSELTFEQGDISAFSAENTYDLIFSNAALQWVNDHEPLFAKLARALTPGGQLAIQMPANHDHISHLVAAEVAQRPRFANVLNGYVRHAPVLLPEEYAALIEKLGFVDQRVHLHVYAHRLESRAGMVDWVKGTMLTDYSKRLTATAYQEFLAEYTKELFARVPDERPFFYPFKRILLWATKV
ncbi:MAG: methyltransferase domain-containing protein [Polyangiaceae bacterium]